MEVSRLQRELGKKNPFDSPAQEAVISILRTSDQFQNQFGRLFREHGLTHSQYNVLRILRGEGKPTPCSQISERMIQAVPAMTGLIDRLEAQELVTRTRCSEDRRVIYVQLTERARKILKRLDAPVMRLHAGLIGHLTPQELAELNRLLEKARTSLDDKTGSDD